MRIEILFSKRLIVITILFSLITFQPVLAEENKSGVNPQVISLPSGPGTIEGLGESFEPQLNTGTAAYSVPLAIPKGINGHRPEISIVYEGGKGNSPFGIGWDMPVSYIQRQTDNGLPLYMDEDDGVDNDHDGVVDELDERDVFIFSNGEELIPLANGDYRCENEQEFIRFRRVDNGWTGTRRDGAMLKFGITQEGRIFQDTKIFRWYLQESQETNGNIIFYKYVRYSDSPGMVYCKEIRYGMEAQGSTTYHSVVFDYEARSDVLTDFRSAFEVTTGRRCNKIEMITQGVSLSGGEHADHNSDSIDDSLVRRCNLTYKEGVDFSLLSMITQIGADGSNYLPPITFDYTTFEPNAGGTEAIVYMENPPPYGFANDNTDLLDVNADGLPDLLHTHASYHFFYENMGNGKWADTLSVMDNGPSSTTLLSNPGTHLSDINGDGIGDLVTKVGAQSFRYHLSTGEGGYEDRHPLTFLGEIPTFPFDGNSNVRLVDINFDKKIDIMLTTSSQYFYWYNLGNGKFSDRSSGTVALINPYFAFKFDNIRARLGDMNGDRLQDLVLVQSGAVCFFPNKGHGQWGGKAEMTNSPVVGFRDKFLLLEDINSDGLYDLILEQTGRAGEIDYWINLGNNSFSECRTITGLPGIISNTTIRIADMNGNSTADIVWSSPFAGESFKYRYLDLSAGAQANLLKSVDNGIGRRIAIDYGSSTAYYIEARDSEMPWDMRLPFPVSVVKKVTVTTGLDLDDVAGEDAYKTEYVYRDGYYDGIEKEFRGFTQVEKIETGDTTAPTQVTRYFFYTGGPDGMDNDGDGDTDERALDGSLEDEPLKGKVLKTEIESELGVMYTRRNNLWSIKALLSGIDGREVRFAHNTEKDTEIIEGTDSPINLKTTYNYDDYGNIVEEKNYGALSMSGDELFTYTEYINDTEQWIVDKAQRQYKTDANGVKVSETRSYYDGEAYVGLDLGSVEKGNLTRQEGWVAGSTYVNLVRNAYDPYGNIIGIMDGNGNLREIEYDATFHTFPVKETIHVGGGSPNLSVTAAYNPGFGTITQSTDFNGHTTNYDYDSFGRVVKIIKLGASFEFPTQSLIYTMADPERGLIYCYDEDGNLTLINGTVKVSSVKTKIREEFGQPGTFDSIQYTDGLGRKLALVEEAEQGFVVKDAVLFNAKGTTRYAFLPYESASSDYQMPALSNHKVETHYDAAGREVLRINPPDQNGTVTQARTQYMPLKNIVTDENNNSKTFIHDGLERLIKVHEENKGENYITHYQYDPLDSLTKITDAQNNVKTMIYDGLKRKTEMDDPDCGHKSYEYDDAGNLIKTIDNKSQTIQYTYDGANRILTEDYLDEDGLIPDVAYHYDTASQDYPDAANVKGALSWIEDLSGAQFFSYDERRNTLWTIKRVSDEGSYNDYKTAMTYDAMDMVVSMTYQDGDQVSYSYNNRTLLESIPGFVDGVDYHASGQIASIDYANGIETSYSYDPRQRLINLNTKNNPQDNEVVQNLSYTLDGVSNITAIADGRGLPPDSPKNASQIFQYDDLYRLTHADGPGYGLINFQYDKIGNMTWKKSPDAPEPKHIDDPLINLGTMNYGGSGDSSNRSGRSPGDPPGPHAVTDTESGLLYDYDDNGNMISHANGDVYFWDFRDRLIRVQKGDVDTQYVYDYGGQRVVKKINDGGEGKTTYYISEGYEIREGKAIKYVFAGGRRVARVEGRLPDTGESTYQTLTFQPGWDFFSLEVEPENTAIGEVLGSIAGDYTEVWTFDALQNEYKGYVPGEGVHDLTEIHAQTGYLINVVSQAMLFVSGTRINDDINITTGWNLIACPANADLPIEEALASIDGKFVSVWHYEAIDGQWKLFNPEQPDFLNDLLSMEPGRAYWIEMKTNGQLAYVEKPPKIYFYHPDHLGSSNTVTDMDGAVVESTEFYPFGRPRYEEKNDFDSAYKYTGKELDKESGLMYYGARYYEPVVGRFVSVDPLVSVFDRESILYIIESTYENTIAEPEKTEAYIFSRNNPIKYSDFQGLIPLSAIVIMFSQTNNIIRNTMDCAAQCVPHKIFMDVGSQLPGLTTPMDPRGSGATAWTIGTALVKSGEIGASMQRYSRDAWNEEHKFGGLKAYIEPAPGLLGDATGIGTLKIASPWHNTPFRTPEEINSINTRREAGINKTEDLNERQRQQYRYFLEQRGVPLDKIGLQNDGKGENE